MLRWLGAFGLLLTLLGLAACTTTEVVSVDLRKVKLMVLGLAAVPENRAKFEDVLATRLDAAGIAAVASHTLMPSLDAQSRESIARIARERGITSVIAVAPVRVEDDGAVEPLGPGAQQHARLGEFIDWGLETRTLSTGQVAFVTNVYQVASGRLLWGGVSWAFDIDDVDSVIEETAAVISENVIAAQRQLLRLNERGIDPTAG
jgi:hypothetical protein